MKPTAAPPITSPSGFCSASRFMRPMLWPTAAPSGVTTPTFDDAPVTAEVRASVMSPIHSFVRVGTSALYASASAVSAICSRVRPMSRFSSSDL